MINNNEIYNLFLGELNNENSDAQILAIIKTGSQIFRESPNDLDFLAICKNYEKDYFRKYIEYNGKKYDLIIRDIDSINYFLINFPNISTTLHNYFFALVDATNTIYGEYTINWDMFEYKNQYLSFIKKEYKNTIGKRINRSKLTKHWVHYYIILKIYENNSIEITEEMLNDINTLYDSSEGLSNIIQWIEDKISLIP